MMFGLVFSAYKFFDAFIPDTGGDWGIAWLPLCMLAILTAIIIYTVFIMAGRAFSIRDLERYGESEMLQAAATAIMALFLVVMVNSALELSQGLIRGEMSCGEGNQQIGMDDYHSTMDDALDGVRCRLQDKAQQIAQVHERVYDSKGEFYTLSLMVGVFGITIFKGDWLESKFQSTETDRITNNLATVMLIGLNAQSYFIMYLKYNMLTVFLPVGILLRSFHFTRGAGALFIATAIGFYFVFPIIFVLMDPGFVHIEIPVKPAADAALNFCYPTMSATATLMSSVQTGGLGGTGGLVMDSVKDTLAESYVSLMLHPLIALSITIVFIRYLMTMLEGDSYEIMKMVAKVI